MKFPTLVSKISDSLSSMAIGTSSPKSSPLTNSSSFFILITLVITVAAAFDSSSSSSSLQSGSNNNLYSSYDKRQPIPMPRIGRSSQLSSSSSQQQSPSSQSSSPVSYSSSKRQMLIPAPRIGRRDPNSGSKKMTRSIDCENNPDLCENWETTNGWFGGGMGSSTNEDLMEPLDIQLRAAFIPRLGKRGSKSQPSNDQQQSQSDYIDIYRPGTIGGRIFGLYTRGPQVQPSALVNQDDQYDDATDTTDFDQTAQAAAAMMMMRNGGEWPVSNQWMKRLASPAYTPRIGRAVFAPRIGKKAAFVPRIG